MNKVGISLLLLVSVCLTVRAAPLTDKEKEITELTSERERIDTAKRIVTREEPNVIDDSRHSKYASIFHPEFVLNEEGTNQDSVTEGSR